MHDRQRPTGERLDLRWWWDNRLLGIEITGDLGLAGLPALREMTDTIITTEMPVDAVRVDLAHLVCTDVVGLLALVVTCRALRELGGSLRVSGASPELRRLMDRTGIALPGFDEPTPVLRPRGWA